jgi:tRNA/rRNA methyltransferase
VDEFAALARIRVVLCEPSHPGNIGAAARALKTMGLARLELVRPRLYPHPDADARATGALDVLQAARCHETLDQALTAASLVCGLSARRRDLTPEVADARAAAREIAAHARDGEAALVFGTERVGLSTDALSRCQRLVRIPANPAYPSLNLAASVQVMAYELRCACMEAGAAAQPQGSIHTPASHEEIERLVAHLERTMRATGFLHPDRPGRLVQRMRRLLARARPESEEVAILRGFLRSVSEREPH